MKLTKIIIATILTSWVTLANATLILTSGMTNPSVTIDFSTFTTGATSVTAINAAAPGAGISSITFSELSGTGVYDSDLGSGNALAANGNGGLVIVPELGTYGNANSMLIVLDHYVTEFGFQLADRADSVLNLFDGATLVGSINTPDISSPPITDFFSSTISFNTIQISQAHNWVIPELVIQTGISVPEPSTIAIFALGMIGLASRRLKK